MKSYYLFIYTDDEIIDSFYPQVYGNVIEKTII